MTYKESIYMLSPIGLMAADEWNEMGNPEPFVEITDNVGGESTSRVRYDSSEAAKCAIMSKKCSGHSDSSVVANWVGKGKFRIMLNN